MKHPLAETLRNPHFQAKTLMVILTILWLPMGLCMACGWHWDNKRMITNQAIRLTLIASATHFWPIFFSFKRHKSVVQVVFWGIIIEASLCFIALGESNDLPAVMAKSLVVILGILILVALHRLTRWDMNNQTPGFEPVMKDDPAPMEAQPVETPENP